MEQKISIIKIGGNVIDNESALQSFLRDFASLPNPKILIHGGGKLASRLSEKLGVETKMIDGRRVTDDQTIDIVTMVYAGLVNKRIVASLSALSCPALGLCGADGNVIPSHLRSKEPIDFGWVGDICPEDINTDFIASLLPSLRRNTADSPSFSWLLPESCPFSFSFHRNCWHTLRNPGWFPGQRSLRR